MGITPKVSAITCICLGLRVTLGLFAPPSSCVNDNKRADWRISKKDLGT